MSNKNNKYSIILPVRNGGEYFRQCVASIISQEYKNFNLHILDNCSTDGSFEWAASLTDERIILLAADRPLTIEESWGRATRIAKNEFCTLIGHDDLLYPGYLSEMEKLITQFPDASLYQTQFNLIDSQGKLIRPAKYIEEKQTADQFLKTVLNNQYDLFGTGYMMRSADYDAVGGIPPYPNLLFADFELWMKLAKKSYMATSAQTCFSYRVHQSTTKVSSDIKMITAFERFLEFLLSLKSVPALSSVIETESPAFLMQNCKGLSHRLLRTSLTGREGLTVKSFIAMCSKFAGQLSPQIPFRPEKNRSIYLAELIDDNAILRKLFILFKKIYTKPVLK